MLSPFFEAWRNDFRHASQEKEYEKVFRKIFIAFTLYSISRKMSIIFYILFYFSYKKTKK